MTQNTQSFDTTTIIDLYETHKDLLSPKSQEALSKKSYNLTQKDDKDFYVCIHLCCRVKSQNLLEGVQAIVADINALSERDLIHSTVAQLNSMELPKAFQYGQTSAVYSFVLVPQSCMEEVLSLVKFNTTDGSTANPVGSLEEALPDGEFLAHVRLSLVPTTLGREDRLNKQIDLFLAVLPKGTELVSTTECGISCLEMSYEVRFRNPLMKRFKEVRLNQVRMAEFIDDQIVQYNLLRGVEHVLRDGSVLK